MSSSGCTARLRMAQRGCGTKDVLLGHRFIDDENAGDDHIFFEHNTPGGPHGALRKISEMIKRSKIPNNNASVNHID